MKIAVIGTGMVGRTLAARLAELGHDVIMGTKDVDKTRTNTDPVGAYGIPAYQDWAVEHSQIKLATFAEAAASAEIVINGTNGTMSLKALELAGAENLAGKPLIDVSNAAEFNADGKPVLQFANTDSLGEQIQRAFPKAKVVKALNIVEHSLMVNPSQVAGNHAVFFCGDDEDAKHATQDLLQAFGWKEGQIVDLGGIVNARATEAAMLLWWRLYEIYGTGEFGFEIKR